MLNTHDGILAIARKLDGDMKAICDLYPDIFTHCKTITWNNRFRVRLVGRCYTRRSIGHKPVKIELGMKYLANHTYDDMLEILLHEAAHGIANARYGYVTQHNHHFRLVCNEIGCYSPNACGDKPYIAGDIPSHIAQQIRRINK